MSVGWSHFLSSPTYSCWAFKPVYTEAFNPDSGSLWYPRCFMHLWCRYWNMSYCAKATIRQGGEEEGVAITRNCTESFCRYSPSHKSPTQHTNSTKKRTTKTLFWCLCGLFHLPYLCKENLIFWKCLQAGGYFKSLIQKFIWQSLHRLF